MQFNLLAFCAGAIVLHFTSWLPLLSESFIKLFVGLLLLSAIALLWLENTKSICAERFDVVSLRRCLLLVVLFCLSYSYGVDEISSIKAGQIKHDQVGGSSELNGSICSIPRKSEHFVQFEFCADHSSNVSAGRYLISLALEGFKDIPGACWHISPSMKPPRLTHNAWQDGYERYLFSQRILGRGYSSSMQMIECSEPRSWSVIVTDWRRKLIAHLDLSLGASQHKGLIYALLLGDRSEINPSTSEVLRMSGIQHLMAISGLHVGLLCWALYGVLLRVGLKRFAIPVLAVFGALYVVMVGFSPSAQRAFIMLLCALYVLLGHVRASAGRALLVALAVVLALDPLAPLSPGFWFSFTAVLVLVGLYSWWPSLRSQGTLKALLLVQLLITLSLVMLQTHFSMPSSVFSLLANIVAIPWVSLVVLPVSLLGLVCSFFSPDAAGMVFHWVDAVLDALLHFCGLALEINRFFVGPVGLLELLAFVALLFVLLVSGIFRYLGLLLGLFVFVYLITPDRHPGEAKLVVLDAGQGLSVFARSEAYSLVYDTGPSSERFSVAKNSLSALLLSEGVSVLDSLILSHGDSDHASDAAWFIWRFGPRQVLVGERERLFDSASSSLYGLRGDERIKNCVDGQKLGLTELSVEVLWPTPTTDAESSNNRSCLVMLTLGNIRILLPGDLEGVGERAMLEWFANQGRLSELRADVLIAGHHGAQKANSFTLLKHVKPRYIVFSAGYENRFGHPSDQVLDRANRIGAELLSTAYHGSIEFMPDGNGAISVAVARDKSNPYWVQPRLAF